MNKSAHMPGTRLGGAFRLVLIFALEVGFIVVLHMLGSLDKMAIDFTNFKQWIDTTPPEVALVSSIRILALGFSYWMLATSFLYMAARAFNIPILIRALELTTVPGVRRAIDAGLAAAIIGGTVFGGAGAVFAKSTNAQANATPAPITSTFKDARVLYNPTPAGDVVGGPTVGLTSTDSATSVQVPQVAVQSNEKVVVVSTDAPGPSAAPSQDTTTPQKDDQGNYIPIPAGGPTTPTEETIVTDNPTTTENSKVTIEPSPADSTTTTTAPKVTVPTTTPPIVTTPDPAVSVDGKQVVRPNDTPAPAVDTSSTSYTVVSGDNFWAIAKAHVESNLGREASNTEVANYWVKLIDANRSSIRSGDPDLIFPGEVFTLPPL